MKFNPLGNYFDGSFHLKPFSGLSAADNIISKTSPFDSTLSVWQIPEVYNDAENCINSAAKAFKQWENTDVEDRFKLIQNYFLKFQESIEQLNECLTYELGTPHWENAITLHNLQKYQKQILDYCYQELKISTSNNLKFHKRPHGLVGMILPFCNSLTIFHEQMIAALLSGNCIIIKPSEKIAYTFQIITEIIHKCGFPNGVINVVHGGEEVVKRIIKDKRLNAIYFTGSVENGKHILEQTSGHLNKYISLGLSSKNCTIVHKDVDVTTVVQQLIYSSFSHSGQRCDRTSIVAVHSAIKDDLISRFHDFAKRLVIDSPLNTHNVFMGPLIDQQAVDKYLLYIGMAKREGLEEIMRGKYLERNPKGNYVAPSINFLKNFNDKSHFLTSELLAPNCTFVCYDEIEEAINIANGTQYGLVSSVFTKDKKMVELCFDKLQCGQININQPTTSLGLQGQVYGLKNSGNFTPRGIGTISGLSYQVLSAGSHSDEIEILNFDSYLAKESL